MVDRSESDGVTRQKQREQLDAITQRARRMVEHLGPLQRREGHRVHFRPGPTGVDMLSLALDRPLQGRPAIKNVAAVAANFEAEFQRWCVDAPRERVSAEKRVQAALIRDAWGAERRLLPLEAAAGAPGDASALLLLTDDLPLPHGGRRFACDVLALRVTADAAAAWSQTATAERDAAGGAGDAPGGAGTAAAALAGTAVVLEFARHREEGVARVHGYAELIDFHRAHWETLFGVLLGRPVALTAPTEKWLFWPDEGATATAALPARIRLFLYARDGEGYRFRAA